MHNYGYGAFITGYVLKDPDGNEIKKFAVKGIAKTLTLSYNNMLYKVLRSVRDECKDVVIFSKPIDREFINENNAVIAKYKEKYGMRFVFKY